MDPDFSWIYLLFFLMIPLARIIPRVLSRMRGRNNFTSQTSDFDSNLSDSDEQMQKPDKHNAKTR